MINNYRKYQRYSICAKAVLIRQVDGLREKLTVQINNLSQGGMGFYAGVFLEKATPVSVELMLDSSGGPDVLEGRIASVSSQGNDYFMGIAFNSDISHDRFIRFIG